jgi:hypothetical protein
MVVAALLVGWLVNLFELLLMYTVTSILVSVRQMEPLLLCEYKTKLNMRFD